MRALYWLMLAAGLAMPVPADAKPKLPEAVAPLPDIEEMLTQAGWTMTPEMSAKFSRPGDILDAKNTTLVDGADCFDAEVKEGAFARMEVTRSMSAGVRLRVKVVGVRGGVALEKKIIFDTPIYRQISRFKLVPTEQCAAFIRSAQQRGEDISGWYVITESLSAVIQQQQCGKYNARAGTFVVSADASITQACAQTSLEPVAVAYKTRPASELLVKAPATSPSSPDSSEARANFISQCKKNHRMTRDTENNKPKEWASISTYSIKHCVYPATDYSDADGFYEIQVKEDSLMEYELSMASGLDALITLDVPCELVAVTLNHADSRNMHYGGSGQASIYTIFLKRGVTAWRGGGKWAIWDMADSQKGFEPFAFANQVQVVLLPREGFQNAKCADEKPGMKILKK
jgi:hypothetical protein